jgi:multidrug efflux pump subunit AcrB
MLTGVSRTASAEFSFFMAIPVMLGASLLKVVKFFAEGYTATGDELLILAIGIVVDDAIVVVESVDKIMNEEHLSPYKATQKAMSNMTSALIATSLVLCAVFVPVSFLDGITGLLYRQFTITIAVSVIISTIVALTLTPVMCALILRPEKEGEKHTVFQFINRWLAHGNDFYCEKVASAIRHSKRVFVGFGIILVAIYILHVLTPQSFMPKEDQGYFTVELELPEGATLERTREVTERAMAYLMEQPDVEHVLNVTGSSPRAGVSQSRSQMTVIMKPWKDREEKDLSAFMDHVRSELNRYPECIVYASSPPVIPGLGSSGGFEMALEARGNTTYAELQMAVDTLLYYASQQKELARVTSSMQDEIPQLYIDVDRDMAKLMGVSVSDIFTTMKAFTGSVYVNDFNLFNRVYRVYIQADAPYRATRSNMNLYFVKGNG